MAISFNKREVEKKKQKKRLEKQKRKEERKNSSSNSFENMIAYVDANGNIIDTPPEETNKEEIDVEAIEVSTPRKVEEEKDPVMRGRVEFFNQDKGYGFIKDLESVQKYFFHISHAPESIEEGNIVTFELERGQKGMNAVKINIES